jgi:protein phosphatase
MKSVGTGRSDVGRVRDVNEDVFLVDDDLGLYVISDGMGGHAAGDVAAELAVTTMGTFLHDNPRPGAPSEVIEQMRDAVQAANRAVHARSQAELELRGMGCTLTGVLMADTFAAIAHVGDSRCYIWREGDVQQLTRDHTLVAELVERGLLTEQEARGGDLGHVLSRAVGVNPTVEVDAFGVELEVGDHLLVCSDGLSGHVDSIDWLARKLERDDLDQVAQELIDFSNARGGQDNVTAVLISIRADGEPRISGSALSRKRPWP